MGLSGKTAIITGSSNGIGRATALLFAQEGANVTITGRNSQRLEETKQLLMDNGVPEKSVNSMVADVTTQEGQDELIKTTLEKFGKIDILVNNAGATIPDSTGATGTDQCMDVYHKNLKLNLESVIEMTKKVKPFLIATKGEIVNVSSIAAGPQAQSDVLYYAIAKAALDQYTRSTAIDLIQHGIRVNSVSPGVIRTGFTDALGMPDEASNKFFDYLSSHKECIPSGAAGKPEDIANVILFLADRELSSYIIGESIVADGGSTLVKGSQAYDIRTMLGL